MVGIIVASMRSKRFPEKMLAKVDGIPLIRYIINKAKDLYLKRLVLATTTTKEDDILAEIAERCGLEIDRGEPKDIVAQFIRIGGGYQLRLNGDSPCINKGLIWRAMRYKRYDLVTNIPSRTYPYGVSVEIIRRKLLEELYPKMSPADKEHVTKYFYDHYSDFKIKNIVSEFPCDLNLAIDYPEDLVRVNEYLRSPSTWHEYRERSNLPLYEAVS